MGTMAGDNGKKSDILIRDIRSGWLRALEILSPFSKSIWFLL